MKKREIGGLVLVGIGFLLSLGGLLSYGENKIVFFIYGIPLFIVGLVVYFNKGEDKIEEINYSKKKGGSKK